MKRNLIVDWITKIFQNSIYAEWAVAFGTMALATTTFAYHCIGDSHTRLMKRAMSRKFEEVAFGFLEGSVCTWGRNNFHKDNKITVEVIIDQFNRELLSETMFLTHTITRKAKKYILQVKKLALAFDKGDVGTKEACKFREKILKELGNLAPRVGKERDMTDLKKLFESV